MELQGAPNSQNNFEMEELFIILETANSKINNFDKDNWGPPKKRIAE